ncbi:MAG: hypothetical protein QOE65_2797 [Solirubrobacteraceae bacterium]|nr:hypothetical protein [Solirubrobacteraceae bacterium]
MKLLLDELYSGAIAEQLRRREHDVVTVHEAGWDGAEDEDLLEHATTDERAVMTNNVQDFQPLFGEWAQEGRDHFGMVFTDDRSMPRSRGTVGLYVKALDAFLAARPAVDALRNAQHWLP